jgi:putative redox protein
MHSVGGQIRADPMAALHTRATVSDTAEGPFAVRIQVDAHPVLGDEPSRTGGGGLGQNPFEWMTAAPAACTAMTMRWHARQQDWPLEHVDMVADHARKLLAGRSDPVDVFEKTILVRGAGLDATRRARLLDVAARCPVQRILEGGPMFDTKLEPAADEVLGG